MSSSAYLTIQPIFFSNCNVYYDSIYDVFYFTLNLCFFFDNTPSFSLCMYCFHGSQFSVAKIIFFEIAWFA